MNATPAPMSVPDFSAHIGCKRNYAYELKKAGRLVMSEDGKKVMVAESIARIAATRDPAHQGVAERHAEQRGETAQTGHAVTAPAPAPEVAADERDEPPRGGLYDFQGSKAKREHFAALEAEASYRQKIRELLEASEVRAVLAEVITVLRTSIEGIPYNLAPVLAATNDEAQIKSILGAEVEHALKTASDSLAKLGRGEL
ncbi:MAG: hypothetical protein Q8R67_05180 [Rhodoferax sp.]|nr:hypothetical protein [Rhodoferax sp.]MDP3651059.1 hypothetical protein [Rhodoferax sp.]